MIWFFWRGLCNIVFHLNENKHNDNKLYQRSNKCILRKKIGFLFLFFWIGVFMRDRWRTVRAAGQDQKQKLVFDIVQMYVSTYVHGWWGDWYPSNCHHRVSATLDSSLMVWKEVLSHLPWLSWAEPVLGLEGGSLSPIPQITCWVSPERVPLETREYKA